MKTHPDSPDALVRLSREDVLSAAGAYEHSAKRVERAGTFGVIAGFATGAILLTVSGALGAPAWLDPILFACGFAVAAGSAVVAWRRQRAALARYQLTCPACQTPLLTARPWRTEVSRAQLVATSGLCPVCGTRLISDDGDAPSRA